MGGVARQSGFGDLEDERGWIKAAGSESFVDVCDDGLVIELAGGDVDCDPEWSALPLPGGTLRAGRE